ncbi:MAG: DUF262 domain-containing protein [Clostridia bacterium]|nr:DUF262 domain-containing protein [Clostridia bacterium]
MQASNVPFSVVLGAFQYQIPYFQRSYVWQQEQIAKFQEDMLYVSDEYDKHKKVQQTFEYFMGTIISKAIPSSTGYQVLDLIDGQQRITTFAVFFKVMSLVYDDKAIFDNIFNFSHGFPTKKTISKLVSSAADQKIMENIYKVKDNVALDKNGSELLVGKKWTKRAMHPLYVAYNMFRDYLEDLKSKGTFVNPDCIVNGVQFVNMTLSGNDDAQVYFDNINSLGVRLTTSAIIKNYIFTHNSNGLNQYETQWAPTFEGVNNKYWNGDGKKINIDEFLFYYLQAKTYDPSIKVSSTDKTLYSRKDAVANHIKDLCEKYLSKNKNLLLNDIIDYSSIYSKIVIDDIGSNTSLGNKNTIDDMLARLGYLISKLKIFSILPYLMFLVYKKSTDVLDILKYIESYLVRRSLIESTTANFNKFFKEVLIAKDIQTLVQLKQELDPKNKRSTDMPDDAMIKANYSLHDYEENETPKILLYLLEIELNKKNHYQSTPLPPDKYTLEHLMPQKLESTFWPGPDQTEDHIYKIGNMGLLTQSLQSIIKNRGWQEKLNGYSGKDGIKTCCSGLRIMQDVINKSNWDNKTIDDRTDQLIDSIISIWKA